MQQKLGSRLIFANAAPGLIAAITATVVLILGGLDVINGSMSVGTLVALQTLSASFMSPVIALTGLVTQFQETGSFTERIDDVFYQAVDKRFAQDPPKPAQAATQSLRGQISFSDVEFGYLPLAPPLVEGFNLTVEPGQRIALVGTSGSGKSTIGRLAAGLLHPSQGQISR